jgi:hypothetical protein
MIYLARWPKPAVLPHSFNFLTWPHCLVSGQSCNMAVLLPLATEANAVDRPSSCSSLIWCIFVRNSAYLMWSYLPSHTYQRTFSDVGCISRHPLRGRRTRSEIEATHMGPSLRAMGKDGIDAFPLTALLFLSMFEQIVALSCSREHFSSP